MKVPSKPIHPFQRLPGINRLTDKNCIPCIHLHLVHTDTPILFITIDLSTCSFYNFQCIDRHIKILNRLKEVLQSEINKQETSGDSPRPWKWIEGALCRSHTCSSVSFTYNVIIKRFRAL